jgi:hypothetical protein
MADYLLNQFLCISSKEKQQTIKVQNAVNLQRKFVSSFPAIVTGK